MTDEHRKTLENLLESLEDGLVNHLDAPPKSANSKRLQREVSALRSVLKGLTVTISVSDGEDPEDIGAVLHFVADRISDGNGNGAFVHGRTVAKWSLPDEVTA
jgi:hypothetical protein